jgi:mono/diheme cytochrome c family protein
MKPALPLLLIGALALASPALAKGDRARGLKIAQRNCAPCHALGRTGDSPNPKSPPFRTLAQRYPLNELEESMGEGIMVGHEGPEMPIFEFRPDQIEDFIAYLGSIQVKKR